MIAVIDYRAGNLTSVMTALARVGVEARLTSEPRELRRAERVIFPGVGAAGDAMCNLRELELVEPLRDSVRAGTPFLGICVGFQLLFERSAEDGGTSCLGIFPGKVVRFSSAMSSGEDMPVLKVPQMGWNEARVVRPHPLFEGIEAGSEFYFVHSYYPEPPERTVCTRTTYGIEFASGVADGNVVAFQFHPEKSGRPGLQLLENFCRWQPASNSGA